MSDEASDRTGATGVRRAVVFDPHPLTRDAIAAVLGRARIEVVAQAASEDDAVAACEREQPDLLLTTNETPSGSTTGYSSLAAAHAAAPHLRSIVISRSDDPHHVEGAFQAGASAYVVRTAEAEDLAAAVRQAFARSIYLVNGRTFEALGRTQVEGGDSPVLTQREREILALVAEGRSNAEIARMLWVTEQTVKFHLSNVYRKLDVSNRTEASRWAHLHGLLDSSAPTPATNG